MPYSGPASAYGTIGKAEAAYFAMINEKGGVNGRKINLISRDDGYSPPKTVEAVRKLVEEDQVLLTFNVLGTPPNTAVQGYLNENKVPQLFVATGADKWNDPKKFPWTMGWQPSYRIEARIYGRYILKNFPNAKIAMLYQNDDFGKDYLTGLKEGLGDKAGKDARGHANLRDHRPDHRLADRRAAGQRRRYAFGGGNPKIRRAGHPQSRRPRLEAAFLHHQRFGFGQIGDATRRIRTRRMASSLPAISKIPTTRSGKTRPSTRIGWNG